MRLGIRPYTLSQRLSKLELSLGVRETPAMALSREMLTSWLATSDQGAELWLDLDDACQPHGGIMALVRTGAGRDLIDAVVSDLYEMLADTRT
jgi:hypothetical protein